MFFADFKLECSGKLTNFFSARSHPSTLNSDWNAMKYVCETHVDLPDELGPANLDDRRSSFAGTPLADMSDDRMRISK